MKRVYLFCSAGMSTSMLASKMQGIANSHLDRALNLAFHAHGIKRLADVVDCRVIQYLYTAVFHIHLDLGKMGSAAHGTCLLVEHIGAA